MKRSETTDISNGEVDVPFGERTKKRGIVVEVEAIVRCRRDLMEVGSRLKAAECLNQAGSELDRLAVRRRDSLLVLVGRG